MNRRQEITLAVVAVLLAGVSAYHGLEAEEWLFAYFLPVLIVGVLAIYLLRDRSAASQSADQILKKGLGLVVLVVLLGHLSHRAEALGWDVSSAAEDAKAASAEAERAHDELQGLERKVSNLEIQVMYLR